MKQNVNIKKYCSLGLMSGTSMDAVDAALLVTDGYKIYDVLFKSTIPYPSSIKKKLSDLYRKKIDPRKVASDSSIIKIEKELTNINIETSEDIIKLAKKKNIKIDIIGYHGQTIYHNPDKHSSIQLGLPKLLSKSTGIDVTFNFRKKDMQNGGQGAPLVPVYHKAIFQDIVDKPFAVINIGGVSNITYIDKDSLIAFDVGPGNSLIDDGMRDIFNKDYDKNGQVARSGKIDHNIINEIICDDFFKKLPPKSLDRNYFQKYLNLKYTNDNSKITTLTYLTAKSIVDSLSFLPKKPKSLIITGGGRKNNFIMQSMQSLTDVEIVNVDSYGMDGQFIEAEAFAFIAVRCLLNIPTSYPLTTGVSKACCGGDFYYPNN
tara:strand:+ start:1152 stop:2273 length:1122 start_codon:yes stop_codon:yes gene_type:complete